MLFNCTLHPPHKPNGIAVGAPSNRRLALARMLTRPAVRVATATLIAAASLLHNPPACADGFDEALELCPIDRVSCVSSYDATPGRFVEPWEYDAQAR